MESAVGLLQNMNTEVLKEPRGFIKVLQFIFTICAFATTTTFSTPMSVSVPCNATATTATANFAIAYNFRLSQMDIPVCGQKLIFPVDLSSDAAFFVTVGVFAFLFTIAVLIVYCFLTVLYEGNPKFPLADCALHAIFAVLYLAASSAWANSLSALKLTTSLAEINKSNPALCHNECNLLTEPNYAKLSISILLGFLNLFLFASNIWFLYKETAAFKEKQAQPETQNAPQQQVPY